MRLGRTKFAICLLCFSLACPVSQVLAKKEDKAASTPDDSEQRRALHALNRLTFGPRPGDLQQVEAIGVDRWIDLQMHPAKINDSALDARLDPLLTLRMSTKEIAEDFPDPQEINQVRNGKKAMPSDPGRRAIFQVQLARLEERKSAKGRGCRQNPDRVHCAGKGLVARPLQNPRRQRPPAAAWPIVSPCLRPEEKEQAHLREEQLRAGPEIRQLPSLAPDKRSIKFWASRSRRSLPLPTRCAEAKRRSYSKA